MDDIKRPHRPRPATTPVGESQRPAAQAETLSVPQDVTVQGAQHQAPLDAPQIDEKPPRKRRIILKLLIVLIGLILLTIGIGLFWYLQQLRPVDPDQQDRTVVTIASGSAPGVIAQQLEVEGLIRSSTAFGLYTRFTGVQNELQAGTYRLSPSESTPEIVKHLTNGNVDTFEITFLPGATLDDHKDVLRSAGYEDDAIDAALRLDYDSPLFAGKPADADLEGYIYGETYRVSAGSTVTDILEVVFTEFESVVEQNQLQEAFAEQGLSLYEGITLASIIQREAIGGDEPQIAQVFYSRLSIGMELGSDVTYQYIADKTGVARDVNLDSPYNTRRYGGLPQGPIASPGVDALLATANPAEGDYLYFLSGDDDVTYFARTLEEHETNIREHCQQKCQII